MRTQAAFLGAGLWLLSPHSYADKPVRACIAAHADGQVARDEKRLLQAQDYFMACSADICPALIRKECVTLSETVKGLQPSVVLSARDSAGAEAAVAHALVDGRRAVRGLDGRPLELDPGAHQIELILVDGRHQLLTVDLREAEKAKPVVATFTEPSPVRRDSVRATAKSGSHPLAYAFGGVGLVALGAFGVFALDGRHKEYALDRCAPHCVKQDVDAMRRTYHWADALLAVSVVSLGASTYLFLQRTEEQQQGSAVWLGARGCF